jgi:Arc/MetJ-type ribon-helix-helix transcriptional regulator
LRGRLCVADEAAIQFVRSKVSSGNYASEAEVVLEGLEKLRYEAEEQARWEREVLVPTHERLIANPDSAVSLEAVRQGLEARRRERRATIYFRVLVGRVVILGIFYGGRSLGQGL